MKRHYASLVVHRAWLDLRAEAAQNLMGMLWWVLEPLLYLLAFYLIFEVFLERGGPGFVGFLLCGLVFWRWFDASLKRSSAALLANGRLINQIYLPKWVFPLIEVVGGAMRFAVVLILFLVFAVLYTGGMTASWLGLLPLLLVELALICGLGLVLSVLVPLYPDLRKVVENFMLLMFYMSGIFFDISRLAPEVQQWLLLNPMAVLIQQFRRVLLQGYWPEWGALVGPGLAALGLVGIGMALLIVLDRKLPHYVN